MVMFMTLLTVDALYYYTSPVGYQIKPSDNMFVVVVFICSLEGKWDFADSLHGSDQYVVHISTEWWR